MELMHVQALEREMPRELYLHPADYDELLRQERFDVYGGGALEMMQEPRPLRAFSGDSASLTSWVTRVPAIHGAMLRFHRYVPRGFMIAVYANRHPTVDVYCFDKSQKPPPASPKVQERPRSLWDHLRKQP